jgi:hypothetical protein
MKRVPVQANFLCDLSNDSIQRQFLSSSKAAIEQQMLLLYEIKKEDPYNRQVFPDSVVLWANSDFFPEILDFKYVLPSNLNSATCRLAQTSKATNASRLARTVRPE